MASPSQLLDPTVLSRITPLGFKAARVVEGSITGLHRSPMHGVSPEFAEHREYAPGDDVRNLDWKVWAKSDRYVTKRYEEESNLRCTMLVDASRSMQYAGKEAQGGRSKFDTASTIAACMMQMLMKQRDSVGLITIDTKPRAVLQPKATNRQAAQILDTLESTKPGGETDLGPVIVRAADQLKRRGMVLVLSDLLCDLDVLYESLGKLQHNGHEVVVMHILDGEEIDLPFNDSIIFKDIEGSEEIFGEPWAFRKAYKKAMEDFIEDVTSRCLSRGIDHVLVRTDQDLGQTLAQYLHRRQRMSATAAGRGRIGGSVFKLVEWAPMEYLKLTLRTNRRRLQLEQWILLLIRTLLILILIFAVARPFLSGNAAAAWLSLGGRTSRVILIDDSLSMGLTAAGESSFQRSAEQAAQLIESLGTQDNLTVVTTSVITSPMSRDAARAAKPNTHGFTVAVPDFETRNPTLAGDELSNLALTSGGAYFTLDRADLLPEALTVGLVDNELIYSDEVWNAPLLILIFLGAILAEWIIRKRCRLV
eukprot:g15618.t1